MRTIRYEVDEQHDGMQVGNFLRGKGFSRAVLTSLKKGGGLKLNGEHIRTVDAIRNGDVLTVCFTESSEAVPNPSLQADIVYDDEDVVVFDKPAYMPTHTSLCHGSDTLENLFSALYPDSFYHSVGRLDKNTSGLIAAAKNKFAASVLMTEGCERPKKVYYAVTDCEIMKEFGECGTVIAPIAREREDAIKRVVRSDGEYAHTSFRVVRYTERYCLHEVTLITGRTHQIRVHFSYIGYPLVGDALYGGDTSVLGRQALHCGKISFRHPVTGEMIELVSPLPDDISALFDNNHRKCCALS